MADPEPLTPEEKALAESREVIDRAERAWQRQVEREDAAYAGPGPMTPFRWVLVAIALFALAVILARESLLF